MISQFQLERRDVEMLIGANKAFALKSMEECGAALKGGAPLEAVGEMFDKAGDCLRKAQEWTQALIDMDRPTANATEGEIGGVQ